MEKQIQTVSPAQRTVQRERANAARNKHSEIGQYRFPRPNRLKLNLSVGAVCPGHKTRNVIATPEFK